MAATVTFLVIQGPQKGQEYSFAERTSCLIGRGDDCVIRLPNDAAHRVISRHHCLLEVHPPAARICDFKSLNGTFVNGRFIGKRQTKDLDLEGTQEAFPQHDLADGDEVQLSQAHTIFKVRIAGVPDPPADPSLSESTICPTHPPGASPVDQALIDAWQSIAAAPANGVRRAAWLEAEHIICGLIEAGRTAPAGSEEAALAGWEYVRVLGLGGMGAVALLRRPDDDQLIALKIMRPQASASARDGDWFRREVENTKALDHPNIVRFWFSRCARAPFFFALEYCPGGSLAAYACRQGGKLSVRQAINFVLQALDGLEYAHQAIVPFSQTKTSSRGLVHRDLKPDNLFLTGPVAAPVVKVGDFGLAKAFEFAGYSGFTQSGLAAGSAGYIPRQQATDFKYVKPDADVWAMAATLYNLLTGTTPRDFKAGIHPLLAVLEQPVVSILQRDPTLPAPLAALVDEALIDVPDIRIKTVPELKRRLLDVLRALVPGNSTIQSHQDGLNTVVSSGVDQEQR